MVLGKPEAHVEYGRRCVLGKAGSAGCRKWPLQPTLSPQVNFKTRPSMLETIERHFRALAPAVDFCSLRFMAEQNEEIEVRQDVLQPVDTADDVGLPELRGGLEHLVQCHC